MSIKRLFIAEIIHTDYNIKLYCLDTKLTVELNKPTLYKGTVHSKPLKSVNVNYNSTLIKD